MTPFLRTMTYVRALITLGFLLPGLSVSAFEAKLRLDGAPDDLRTSLETASLVFAAQREGTENAQDILAAAQADYGRLVSTLYQEGYYGPVVSILVDGREAASLPPLTRLPNVTRVTLRVDAGPAFELGKAEIGPVTTETTLPEGFRSGAPARTSVIRDAALAAVDGWRAVGFAKADVAQQDVVALHDFARLDVQLRIEKGPKVRFGQLRSEGAEGVRAGRIEQIAGIPSGEVFDPKVLENAAARLRRTGTFSSVTLREADQLGAGDTLDVDLTLAEAKPRRFGFGAELHSSEGVSLSGFWLHRNLFGGAERFRVEGEISGLAGDTDGIDYTLGASLTRPSTFNTETDLFLRAELDQLDEPHYFTRLASAEVGLTRYFSDELTAEGSLAFRYSEVEDDLGSRTFTHLAIPLSVTWDRRNDALDTTSGSYLMAEATPFLGLAGSASGGRVYLDARAYRGVAEDRVVLAARLQFGSVMGASIAETPPDMLFLSGGSGTVRGQSYQSLAIDNGTDETGGRSFVGLSGEVRTKFTDTISGVAFYDMGYIGANSFVDDTGGWHAGAGLGLRYQTGLGPIRLDVAAPVSGGDSGGVQFYLGIGQAF